MSISEFIRALVVTGAAAAALAPGAQATTPKPAEVHASATDRAVTLAAPPDLRPGAIGVRLSVHSPTKPQTLTVVRLKHGADGAEVAAIDTDGLRDVRRLEKAATIVTGATVRPGVGFRTTIAAKAGRYAVIDSSADPHAY